MKKKKSNLKLMHLYKKKPIKGLCQLLYGYKLTFLVAIISMSFAVSAATIQFLLLRYYIDEIIVKKIWTIPLYHFVLGFLAIAIFRGIFSFIHGRANAHTSEGIARDIRNIIFDHIQRQTFAYHDKTPTGKLIQRSTSDVDAVRRFYSEQIMGIFRILFLFIINFITIFFLQWDLALYSIIIIPFVLILSGFFFRIISKVYESYQKQCVKLSAV